MKSQYLLFLVFFFSTIFGLWYRKKQGEIKTRDRKLEISSNEIGEKLGTRLTLLQFSSAFCSPCKATAAIITNLTKELSDVAYIQIKSEERLDLIEKFKIQSTPTVVLFDKSGLEVGRAVGTPTKEQVLASIAAVR